MNVLYAVTFPAEPARVDRVRASIEQCLDASPLDPAAHADLARAAAALLALAVAWTDDGEPAALATLSVRVEATADAYAVTIDAALASGATRTLTARFAPAPAS